MTRISIPYGDPAQMTPFACPLYSARAMKVLVAARSKAERYYRLASKADKKTLAEMGDPTLKLYATDRKRKRSSSLYYYCDDPVRYLDGRIGVQLRVKGSISSTSTAVSREQAEFIKDEFDRYSLGLDVWKQYPELEIFSGVKAKDAACVHMLLTKPLTKVKAEFGPDFVDELIGCPDNPFVVEQRRHLISRYNEASEDWYRSYYEETIHGWKLKAERLKEVQAETERKHSVMVETAEMVMALEKNRKN